MGLGDFVQKAVYLGIGLASYAGEKASGKLAELRVQAQKLADELVERGEMTTDEARRFVDEMLAKAQQPIADPVEPTEPTQPKEPRQIEIITDDEEPTDATRSNVDEMRQKVRELQEELRRLQRDQP
jgi:polyhydroxyalkanoate synthesis regulator phasin